jgi:uncharacterized protein YybS (DUF2232 family)
MVPDGGDGYLPNQFFTKAIVPEPPTFLMIISGLATLLLLLHRKSNKFRRKVPIFVGFFTLKFSDRFRGATATGGN